MPELPEVETVKRDLAKRLNGKYIKQMVVHCGSLRVPIPTDLPACIKQRKVIEVSRRAKYVLVGFRHGTMGIHLGMSGTVRADAAGTAPRKHDHVEWHLAKSILRYHDPRRFGRVFWTPDPTTEPLLRNSGIEPLGPDFTTIFLYELSRSRKQAIKVLLMDSSRIAGIGNIYASESLFRAKVRPQRHAGSISRREAAAIVRHARKILREAIAAGGSSLRDHTYGDGKLGYFQFSHRVYGRADQPCLSCDREILRIVLGQRASFYCPGCQR